MEINNSGAYRAVLHEQISRRSLGHRCKKHRLGLGPIETRNSDANRVVLYAENDS